MRKYGRIVYEDRCQIHALSKVGKTQAEIGVTLGFSQGAVSRELARNSGRRGYRFKQAQSKAQSRQDKARSQPRKLTARLRRDIARKMRAERWSPEQISFWLRDERGVSISHEWIYRMIWDDKRADGDLWRCLRRRGKKYNRRSAQNAGRGVIPGRNDISERPAVVGRKTQLGDWEGDTIVGTRPHPRLLPKRNGLLYSPPCYGREGRTPAQPQAEKIARFQNAKRGLSNPVRTPLKLCTGYLNPHYDFPLLLNCLISTNFLSRHSVSQV